MIIEALKIAHGPPIWRGGKSRVICIRDAWAQYPPQSSPFKNGVGDPHQWVEGRGYHGQVHAHGQDALFRLLGSYLVNIVNMRNLVHTP